MNSDPHKSQSKDFFGFALLQHGAESVSGFGGSGWWQQLLIDKT
jgi:hypothetical protein